MSTNRDENADELILEITDVLDLHSFLPQETKPLVRDYLDLACEKGWTQVQIVHGRGIGVQRQIVHSVLERHPRVIAFSLVAGNPGATFAKLDPS